MLPGEKAYLKWLDAMWKKWAPILFLQTHEVKFKRDDTCHMASSIRYPYLSYTVFWSLKSLNAWKVDPVRQEHVVVHEFCHLLTDGLYTKATKRVRLEG